MKRFLSVLIVLTFGAIILASCQNPNDSFVPAGYKKASDKNADYILYVPDGWTVEMSTGVTTAYVSESDRSNISFMGFELDPSIIKIDKDGNTPSNTSEVQDTDDATSSDIGGTVADTPDNTAATTSADNGSKVPEIVTVDEYWAYYSSEFEKTFSDMEYSVSGENLLVSGVAAKKYVYTATVTGQKYEFMQVIVVKNGTVYIFTYTAHEELFDKHLDTVNKIIGYIELK